MLWKHRYGTCSRATRIQDAPGILKQFSLRLDALEMNLEATDNARYAENMEWEGRGSRPNQSWGSKNSWALNSSTQQKSGVGFKAKPDASTSGEVQRGEQSGSQSRHPPTVERTDAQDYEEEDVVGAFPQWCNAVTTQVRNPKESLTGKKPKDMPPKKKGDVPGKGLMYVDIKVNRKAIRAMVDTGATHNYISSTEVERLGLTLKNGCGRVKAINSAAQPVTGIARSVLIKIGPYEGRTNFSVVIMDDFKLILRLEFLRDTKTTVMTCTNSLTMLRSKPYVISTISLRAGERSISALQLKKGVKRDETTYLAMLWAGSTNSVADAFNRKAELDQVTLRAMNAIVRADSRVAINIGKKIRKALTRDLVAQQLLKLIESCKTRQFWQEDGTPDYSEEDRQDGLQSKSTSLVEPPLHSVFHVSMLKPFYEDTADPSRGQIRRQGLKPKAAGKRVAEAILNDRVITASRKRHQEYLVKWLGYMEEEHT
ncbi:hypothetical protein RJ639_013103 [Escallonia herrerae]|uniref:Chromo domain-containing protein n=1 Tax=Escallonia herrerae TaxID=1293975 RepID=A0AA89ANZ0_9ASTE|nr:hypothetical protein RJ639_013103 [Escallonia herrerae]